MAQPPPPPPSPSPWLASFHDHLQRLQTLTKPTPHIHTHSIFKVPHQLRDVHPLSYDPLVICLGPYRKPRKLEPSLTEAYITISSATILLRQQGLTPPHFNHLASTLVGSLHAIMDHYERPPVYENHEVVTLLFAVDASFVVCFLLHLGFSSCKDADAIRTMTRELNLPGRLVDSIVRDLFLLENQIPLGLLERAAMLFTGQEGREDLSSCIEYTISRVNPFQFQNIELRSKKRFLVEGNNHILGCLYNEMIMIMGKEEELADEQQSKNWVIDIEEENIEMQVIESAVHLRRAGIQFKAYPSSRSNLDSKIYFDETSSTLFLPQIKINPDSESLLRNLAAYEIVALQRAELCSYLALMDDLIDTPEDVLLLRSSGVLTHCLRNDKEIAALWNSICKNLQVLYEPKILKQAYMGIKRHLKKNSRYKMFWELYADFSNRYLSAPWLTASVLAATLLLVLTVIQTTYSAAIFYKS